MRDRGGRIDSPSLDFDPISLALIDNLAVQIQKVFNPGILTHYTILYHLLIKYVNRPPLFPESQLLKILPDLGLQQGAFLEL